MFICTNCKKECDFITVCEMCGEEPQAIDVDYSYCRFCKEHTEFIDISECCVADVAFTAPDINERDN